ncbi:hypothetical protein MANES_11G103150v8 [Manihot esculenta]|uniref:Uncharacterized protein n=1 Tax=Manihot esculenta TaxID=3983 RepID=A0ACB7GUT6_MANES|nr:hypothetical protein MANES_11G103150v8 [Manihot esculenta]
MGLRTRVFGLLTHFLFCMIRRGSLHPHYTVQKAITRPEMHNPVNASPSHIKQGQFCNFVIYFRLVS